MTNLSKSQLNTILSALDGQPRNPNSRDTALRAIGRHAGRLGLDELLADAAGLLDGRVSADEFRAQVHEDSAGQSLDGADQGAGRDGGRTDQDSPAAGETPPEANHDDGDPSFVGGPVAAESLQSSATAASAPTLRQQLLAACKRAAEVLHDHEIEEDTLQMLRAAIARAEGQPRRAATGTSPKPPRSDSSPKPPRTTKQARLIALLQRGASIDDMAREFGWLRHTCHGALAGLKMKRGLSIISSKPAQGERIYRLDAPAEQSAHAD